MKPIELRESDFRREIDKYTFPEAIKKEFFDYWTEPNKSGSKMRFELEKTWHLGRRLARWANNTKGVIPKTNGHTMTKQQETPTNDFDRLDAFIVEIRKPGASIPFEDYGKWYEFMKGNKLLRPFSRDEVEQIKECYPHDNNKCRCAVVKQTLSGYVSNEITIKDILRIRNL